MLKKIMLNRPKLNGFAILEGSSATFRMSKFCKLVALGSRKAFTLIEILIVISIIAILASTIIPNFVGFDSEARIVASKSNLESIRTRVNLFRAKEGHYPESLEDLTTTFYYDVGVKKPYLKKIPTELISSSKGVAHSVTQTSEEKLSGDGGWVYITDMAEVKINIKGSLGKEWGDFSEENPSEW